MKMQSVYLHKVEEAFIILVRKGSFKQTEVYSRKGYLYARHGSGFIRLQKHEKGTSCPNVYYDDIYLPFEPEYDNIGRMMLPNHLR